MAAAAAALGLLTLIAIPRYRLAFGTRSGCVALALVASHQSGWAAAERAEDVTLGGLIGLAAYGLVMVVTRRWRLMAASSTRPDAVAGPFQAAALSSRATIEE